MTEKDFWTFLKSKWAQGRAEQVSMVMDSDNPQIKERSKFIGAHSYLPKGYDKFSAREIAGMGRLLLGRMASISTKEVILVLLAHIPSKEALGCLKTYNERPDEELRFFTQLALDEYEMWNEE